MSANQELMTVNDFMGWAHVGRTKTYELLGSGEIAAVKIGSSTRIITESARSWRATLPSFGGSTDRG